MKTQTLIQTFSRPTAGHSQFPAHEAVRLQLFRRLTSQSAEVTWVGVLILIGCFFCWATSRASAAEALPLPAAAISSEQDAGALIAKSHAFLSSVASFEVTQTKIDRITRQLADKTFAPAITQSRSSVVRVVNGTPMLVELMTTDSQGRSMHVIRRGEQIVLQLGTDPWQLPTGPYASMKDLLATIGACSAPGTGGDSTRWRFVATAPADYGDCDVVETVGDNAVSFAAHILEKSFAAFSPDAARRPVVQVLSYSSRQWIGRSDARRVRGEQKSRMHLVWPGPNGELRLDADIESTTTVSYGRYGEVAITIPAEAGRLLAVADSKS